MRPRLSLVTLGVASLEGSRAFYERLGWRRAAASQDGVTFFQLNGIVLALYPRDALAADCATDPVQSGFANVTLAQNYESITAVDAAYASAVAAGAGPRKPPEATFWGGYSGCVADPDGLRWELAFNPFFPLDLAGNLALPA